MKKLLTLSALLALTMSGYSQGLVTIAETSFNVLTNSLNVNAVSGSQGKLIGTANSYYFTLLTLANPTGTTTTPVISSATDLLTGWFEAGVTGTNATGINAGKISAIGGIPGAAASSWAAGSTNFTVVVGWSATEGLTWSQIATSIQTGVWADTTVKGAFGYTLVGYGASTAVNPGFAVFGANPGQLSALTLNGIAAVPEPATMVLAGLGGLSLLAFRRKK